MWSGPVCQMTCITEKIPESPRSVPMMPYHAGFRCMGISRRMTSLCGSSAAYRQVWNAGTL